MSSLYRKPGSKIWRLRVMVRGREHRESLRTDNRAVAEKRAAKRLEALNRAAYGDQRYTWKAAVVAWENDPGELKPQTIRRYRASLAAIDHILGRLFIDEIDKGVLAEIAGRKGVTNATRKRDLTAVSVVLHAAELRGWIESVPVFGRRRLREVRAPLVLPHARDIDALWAVLPPMLGRLVRLLEQTGMRLEEAGGLRWANVDTKRLVVTLTETKANKVRIVPLTDEAMGTLLGTPRHVGSPYVFWHSQEEPRRYGDLSGLLYDYRKRAGVPWRIHDLRHLYAVRYLQNGGSIYDLQKILGHSTLMVTERYLDHLSPDEQAIAKRTAS